MKRTLLSAAVILATVISAQAQDLKTGYFLDNYLYGSKINPALQPDNADGYFGLILNDFTLGFSSNAGVSNFFFPYNGKLVNGLNKNISSSTFLGNLKATSSAALDLDENIFTVGFRSAGGKAFSTVSLNLKSGSSMGLPKTLFEFLKDGADDQLYTLTDIGVVSRNYLELSYGYSRKINDLITVGATVKGLLGLAYVNADVQKLTLDTSGDEILATGQGSFSGSIPFTSFPADEDGYISFDDVESSSKGLPAGFGLACDLGVTVTPMEGLTVSAALLDLGFIGWKQNVSGSMSGTTSFTLAEDENIGDELKDMFKFKSESSKSKVSDLLNTRANIGARYVLPFAGRKLSVGALCSFRMGDSFSRYTDFRAGLTFTPGKALSLTATAGYSTYGFTSGAAINLRAGFVNFFAGMDGIFTKVTAQYLPVNPVDAVAKVGLSFCIGHKDRG